MTEQRTYSIEDIEALTEQEAAALAIERMEIKDHTVYFVDFGGYFKYSCLVFRNGYHIHYANDYELHHNGRTRDELREWYIDGMNRALFTEEEIAAPLTDYDEYDRKDYFLRNYYGMASDYLSCWGNFSNEKFAKAWEEKKKAYPYVSPISFGYYADESFARHLAELYEKLQAAKNAMADNFEYYKGAFKHEMANHEYHINWQADFDTLSAFGFIQYHGDENDELEKYFDELKLNDTQRRAYLAARTEYLQEASENDLY